MSDTYLPGDILVPLCEDALHILLNFGFSTSSPNGKYHN